MAVWLEHALWIVLGSIAGSGGFSGLLWRYLESRDNKKNATAKITMGLAYTELTRLGIEYINRGGITTDELSDYQTYFYEPYVALGGNGVAKRIMAQVIALPLHIHTEHAEIFRNSERLIENVPVYFTASRPEFNRSSLE